MPQMAPTLWLIISAFLTLTLLLMLMFIYFLKEKEMTYTDKMNPMKPSLKW
uniref:ATP8 protein n=1 Tax=Haploginglymus sp. JP-2016 TaxID=1867951 RepID=A0A330J191_9CRUS|nr:ATP8 [Haploginglymus sp. JP-2016]